MKKVIMKEQDQQYRYAGYYVKIVDALDHLIPRQTQAKIHPRSTLCGGTGQLNILTSTPAMELCTDCCSQRDTGNNEESV